MSVNTQTIYHLNVNFGLKISGVEKSAVLRHQVLREQYQSRMLTMLYNPKLANYFQLAGVEQTEYANMFDFFQESLYLENNRIVTIDDIFPQEYYQAVQQSNKIDYRIYHNEKYIAYLRVFPNQSIEYINYFDETPRKTERHLYDYRGFLSLRRVLDSNNQSIADFYYSPEGKIKLERYFDRENQVYYQYFGKNQTHYLKGDQALQKLFLDLFLKDEDIVVLDGSKSFGEALVNSTFGGEIIAVLHSKHYIGYDPQNALNSSNKVALQNLERIYKVITASELQRQDVVERFHNPEQVVTIPVGVRTEVPKNQVIIDKEKPIKIGVVARYSVEKRLDHAIRAFSLVHQVYPNSELHLYGFSDARDNYKTQRELVQLAKSLNVYSAVKFRGYITDLTKEYQQIHIKILTSLYEGFCLAILEAISRGIPTVAYDIKYGPSDMIDDDSSGYLVENGNYEQLADRILRLIDNPYRYQAFSNQAYQKAKDFSKEKILELWQTILPK